jgi:hypothetical protein
LPKKQLLFIYLNQQKMVIFLMPVFSEEDLLAMQLILTFFLKKTNSTID